MGDARVTARDMALATLCSVIWGLAFVATRFGLDGLSAPQLTAARFIVAALPVLFVPRPRIGLGTPVLIGLTLFAGQFLLLFFAFTQGMPPGLASVTQQMQAFFTVLLTALFLGERPGRRQQLGLVVAFAGLVLIGLTIGGDLKPIALALALGAAASWAVGNLLTKRAAGVPVFPLMAWCSLVPPLPALALSAAYDETGLLPALVQASWLSLAAALYLGAIATTLAYALWGDLLRRYAAAQVAPFALIAPCTGVIASAAIFGEAFPPMRYAGMALILTGLVVTMRPERVVARQ